MTICNLLYARAALRNVPVVWSGDELIKLIWTFRSTLSYFYEEGVKKYENLGLQTRFSLADVCTLTVLLCCIIPIGGSYLYLQYIVCKLEQANKYIRVFCVYFNFCRWRRYARSISALIFTVFRVHRIGINLQFQNL